MILIAGGGAAVYFLSINPSGKVNAYVPPHLTAVQQAEYLADHNNYQAAENRWHQMLAQATGEQTKMDIYYQQFALALKYKQYSDAQDYINQEKKLDSSSSTPYESMAQLAQAQGKHSLAKSFWLQAINHLDPNLPQYGLLKQEYQSDMGNLN